MNNSTIAATASALNSTAANVTQSIVSNLTCSHLDLIYNPHTVDFLCKASINACKDSFDLVNTLEIFWCYMGGYSIIFYPIMFILIALAFKYTSVVVDEYIAEGITVISETLGFSESLAAVTLLAFANGAGDVITSIVASGSEGGVSYNIGALFGAGLFVCSLVVAICII